MKSYLCGLMLIIIKPDYGADGVSAAIGDWQKRFIIMHYAIANLIKIKHTSS